MRETCETSAAGAAAAAAAAAAFAAAAFAAAAPTTPAAATLLPAAHPGGESGVTAHAINISMSSLMLSRCRRSATPSQSQRFLNGQPTLSRTNERTNKRTSAPN